MFEWSKFSSICTICSVFSIFQRPASAVCVLKYGRYVTIGAHFYDPFTTIFTLQKFFFPKIVCLLETQAQAKGPSLSHSVILLRREPVLNVISAVVTSNPAIAVSLSAVGRI